MSILDDHIRKAMRSSGKIYAQTDKAKAILKKMAAKAADIESQKKELEKLSAATETCWKGLSGDALREKLAALIKEQAAIAKDLEQNAESMCRLFQQLEDEDQSLASSIRCGNLTDFGSEHTNGRQV